MGLLRDLVGGSFEIEPSSVLADLFECRYNALEPVDYGRKHLETLMASRQPQEVSMPLVDVMPEKVAPVGPQLTIVEKAYPEANTDTPDPENQASRLARAQEALEGAFDEAA